MIAAYATTVAAAPMITAAAQLPTIRLEAPREAGDPFVEAPEPSAGSLFPISDNSIPPSKDRKLSNGRTRALRRSLGFCVVAQPVVVPPQIIENDIAIFWFLQSVVVIQKQ